MIEAIKRLDALLEYAVMHNDEEEAERTREELRKLTDKVLTVVWRKCGIILAEGDNER